MAKKYLTDLDDVVTNTLNSTNIDESLIEKFIKANIKELKQELEKNDEHYDARVDKLIDEHKNLFSEWIEDKQKRRNYLENLAISESNLNKKRSYIREWLKINCEIDVLFSSKKEYIEKQEMQLRVEKANKQKRLSIMQISSTLIPIVTNIIIIGLKAIANRNNIAQINNKTNN